MRLRTKQEAERQVLVARLQMDRAVDRMTDVLDKVQDQVITAKEELNSMRSDPKGGATT